MNLATDYKKSLVYVAHARMWNIFRVIEHLKNHYNKEESKNWIWNDSSSENEK